MKRAVELREQLRKQIAEHQRILEALQNKLEGCEMAIRAWNGEPEAPVIRKSRANTKQIILNLLEEAKTDGLNSATVVDAAEKRNERIERPTASSLLSRFKAEGLVTYDGRVYRLKKYSASASPEGAKAMH